MLSIKFTALALWTSLTILFFELDPRLHALALVALLVAIGFRIYGILRRRRAKRLVYQGIKVDAVVTSIEPGRGLKIDGRRPSYVTCEGRSPSDYAGVSFRSQGLWNYIEGTLRPGDGVQVYVDRANPRRYFVMAIQPGMKALVGSTLFTIIARYSIPVGIVLFFLLTPNEPWLAAREGLYEIFLPPSVTGTFQVLSPSPDRLVVVAPPDAGLAALVSLICAAFFFWGRSGKRSDWGLLAFLLIMAGVLDSLLLAHGQVTFDKQAGTVTFDRVDWLLRADHATFPLDDVRFIRVRQTDTSYQFVVVFSDDGEETLRGLVSSSGQIAAAVAANRFLGRTVTREW